MRQTSIGSMLILALLATAHGQSPAAQTMPRAIAVEPSEPEQPRPKYLTDPLDLNQIKLGQNFKGHDITAVIHAIMTSPALQEKSEFETSSAFQARVGGFIENTLYANIRPNGYFGFVVDQDSSSGPAFKYDADTQNLVVTLTDRPGQFTLDSDKATLDKVLIRRIVRREDSYIGSNAFGATVEVERTNSEEYGIAFNKNNWLFQPSESYETHVSYLLPMTPEEARTIRPDAKLLLVCRLTQPWFHIDFHRDKATIDWPYENHVDEYYLQVISEQLWIFNQRTGQVVRKLTAKDSPFSLAMKLDQITGRLNTLSTKIRTNTAELDALKIKCPQLWTDRGCLLEEKALLVSTQNIVNENIMVLTNETEALSGQEQTLSVLQNQAAVLRGQNASKLALDDIKQQLVRVDNALETAK